MKSSMFRTCVGAVLVALSPQVFAYEYDFESGIAGWWATGTSGYYDLPASGQSAVGWDPMAGNPDSCIYITDVFSETFFAAPSAMLGNQLAQYGKYLNYDIYLTYSDNVEYPAVILTDGSTHLYYGMQSPPTDEWTHVEVPFAAVGWRRGSYDGAFASEQDMKRVLSNLKGLYINAEWNTGSDLTYLDNVTTAGQVPFTSGKVELQDWFGMVTGQRVTFEFSSDDGAFETSVCELSADGAYSVSSSDLGLVTIYAKASHWLRQGLGEVLAGTANGPHFSLQNGDVDDDNSVTVFDYSELSDAFDTIPGDMNWNASADLDGDGSVTVFDYAILSQNFDLFGD